MKILVSYDPPMPNMQLLERVIAEAKIKDVHVYLVTSLYDGREKIPEEIEKVEEELEKVKTQLVARNISVETHVLVRRLTPGEDIVAFAKENNIDEIFIHLKKTSRVGKMLTGSNAQYILLNAHCPVVSVR